MPANTQLRDKVHALFEEFDDVQIVTLKSGRLYILRREQPRPDSGDTTHAQPSATDPSIRVD